MWSPLIEADSDNLALSHCSCLHACLAAYSNILRRDMNTVSMWLIRVQYYDLLDWIRAKWLRIDWKIVPVSEKLRRDPWGFRQQGWSSPTERSTSTTVNSERKLNQFVENYLQRDDLLDSHCVGCFSCNDLVQ